MPDWRWAQVPFHSAVEVAGGLTALALAGILLARWTSSSDTRHHLWMSAALVGMGVLDIAHAGVSPGETFVWFHSTATLAGGVLFAMVWLPARITDSPRRRLVVPLTGAAVLRLCVCTLGFPAMVPAMVQQGEFSATARCLNILGGVGFLAASGWFLKRHHAKREWDNCLFCIVCCLFGAAGVLFELSTLWDAAWWWWHLLRLAACFLALTYSVFQYYKTNARLDIAQRELEQTNLDMTIGLSEVCDGLGRIADGDPDVRISEDSNLESIVRLKAIVNRTAKDLGKLVEQFHEMAIGLAEHFDVMHRVTQGDMNARVVGATTNDLLRALKEHTNTTIASLASREEQLTASNHAAEAANRTKSEFLANMSHEIRTPMTAILGFTDILLNDLREPEAIEAARTVKRNAEHLLRIINDILDISKIEAGEVEMQMVRWSPRQVVAEVVSLLHVRAAARGLTLADEYVGPLPETITTDPTRLHQILVNLVGNAIKFTETGGVRFVTRLVEPPGGEPKLQFDVIDTSIGVPPEQIENIFEPFTQADGSSSRKFEGTGLGLAISRKMAGMLGGDIRAKSSPGNGSTFTATVATGPLDGIRLVEHLTEDSPAGQQRVGSTCESQKKLGCRVLLAEDIPDNQRLISAVLREAGAEVTIAQDGQEAVEKALATCPERGKRHSDLAEPFDVILMDVQMPALDGHEATRRLRREGYTGPIIALTAHAMRGDRQECLDAGCDDYLTKPIDRKKLLEAVARCVSRRHQQPAAAARSECGGEHKAARG